MKYFFLLFFISFSAVGNANSRRGTAEAALLSAVRTCDEHLLDLALAQGGDINAKESIYTAIQIALYSDCNISIISKILSRRPQLTQLSGDSVITLAMQKTFTKEKVKLLLSSGANVNEPNRVQGQDTALYRFLGDYEKTIFLLGLGANPNAATYISPLTVLAPTCLAPLDCPTYIKEILSALFKAGMNPNFQDAEGKTPLMKIIESRSLLLSLIPLKTYQLNLKSKEGLTAVFYYVANKGIQLHSFFEAGADLSLQNQLGQTPLMMAISLWNIDDNTWGKYKTDQHLIPVNFLLRNTNLSKTDVNGNTVLHYLLLKRSTVPQYFEERWLENLLPSMVANGLPIHQRNKEGLTALAIAEKFNMYTIAMAIKKVGGLLTRTSTKEIFTCTGICQYSRENYLSPMQTFRVPVSGKGTDWMQSRDRIENECNRVCSAGHATDGCHLLERDCKPY